MARGVRLGYDMYIFDGAPWQKIIHRCFKQEIFSFVICVCARTGCPTFFGFWLKNVNFVLILI